MSFMESKTQTTVLGQMVLAQRSSVKWLKKTVKDVTGAYSMDLWMHFGLKT